MKPILPATFLAILGLTLTPGCQRVAPGHDPVVVRAEQLAQTALEVIDGYLLVEHGNRQTLAALSPEFKRIGDVLRLNTQPALQSLRAATKTYKANRTEENRASLTTAIAVVQTMMFEAETWLARASQPELLDPNPNPQP